MRHKQNGCTLFQKGTAEDLPLGSSAPILGIGTYANPSLTNATNIRESNLTNNNTYANYHSSNSATAGFYVKGIQSGGNWYPQVFADLTSASAPTIGMLYQSFAIQDLLQTDARGGTRYVELLNAHFGVTSPDYRLQRPEYLGGASIPFIVSPLAQTSETGTTELGTLGATAAASINNVGFFKSFVEHGWVLGLMCVRADLTYQQGTHRSLLRDTRYDFYFPALANLGEQEVFLTEIYTQGTAEDDDVFGY